MPVSAHHEQQIQDDNDLADKDQPPQPTEQSETPTRPSRHPRVDYKFLNDPFPDEEEADMALVVQEEVQAVLPEDECRDLK